MQNFQKQKRVEPAKKDVLHRLKNYNEIYEPYAKDDASSQASRCVQCGDPYCLNKCPLNNYIPQWLKRVHGNDLELAFKLSNQTSPFPEIMGRVCPQDRLCEGDCTLNDGFGAITIGSIETFVSEQGFKKGLKLDFTKKRIGKKVSIIGSGPAGLSAATFLIREGFEVEMYERSDRAGGLLHYGIPSFKLEKEVVKRRIDWLVEAGMKLHLNTEVGKTIEFGEIANNSDAVFVAIGATKSNELNLLHSGAKNIHMAIDFLTNVQKKNDGKTSQIGLEFENKNVLVVGGGDTAMDCLRTSVRLGAKSVKCLYRRDAHNMPGSKKEYKNAIEEGVEFVFNVAPKEIIINDSNEAIGIDTQKTKLVITEDGKSNVEVIKGSEERFSADVIILALGFGIQVHDFIAENGIATTKWGEVIVDENQQTSQKGIYAGGDCSRGADLVVTAALDGRTAAEAIIRSFKS